MTDPILNRPYVQNLLQRMEDCERGGMDGKVLVNYYEEIMGHPWDPTEERNNLPELRGKLAFFRELTKRRKMIQANVGSIRNGAVNYISATANEEMSYGENWRCPYCGPVKDFIHGDDGLFHCLECDSVVNAVIFVPKKLSWLEESNRKGFDVSDPRKCNVCEKKFTPPPGPGFHRKCSACRKGGKVAKKIDDIKMLPAVIGPVPELASCASALVKVAAALEGLNKEQIKRVLGWVQESLND